MKQTIKISAASLARFKAFANDFNRFNGLVEGLIERDYHLLKNVADLTDNEKNNVPRFGREMQLCTGNGCN